MTTITRSDMPAALSKVDEFQIADGLARGATGDSLAKALGICPNTVSRKKKQLRPLIEALAVHYFEQATPLAIDSTLKALKTSNDILSHAQTLPIDEKVDFLARAKDMLAVTDKKEARVLVSMGVSPSPTTSIFVQNLMISGNQTVLLPQIQLLFGGNVSQCESDDVIDVDVRECDSAQTQGDPFVGDCLPCEGNSEGNE
jgi:hypothetical protein